MGNVKPSPAPSCNPGRRHAPRAVRFAAMSPAWMTVKEAADRLGVSRQAVEKMVRSGRIPPEDVTEVMRGRRIRPETVERIAEMYGRGEDTPSGDVASPS